MRPDKLRPVGRLGGVTYARVSGGYALARPAWKDLTEEEKALARWETVHSALVTADADGTAISTPD
ncbi:hypothetical protein HYPSUDRAFT_210261 [Hypholoma sublateritium FD-334 SS-4]|uniref:Uncharacterized protein n=1 Tax=Hypholoma sublateritium (strain FD-334 SS-4) TaxID=945553 RepID=A0A0D2N7B1_HYPSF|nr:hypothetical protein HYPSUDRAFT_210261 [Hypholoma sublateritium FD-334 SS-4]